MNLENIKNELNSLIKDFEKEVKDENKTKIKTSNYDVLCQRLEEAKSLKNEIEEAESLTEEISEFFIFRLEQLKFPIL